MWTPLKWTVSDQYPFLFVFELQTVFIPVFEQKIQGLFKDFQGNISYNSKKEPGVCLFQFFQNMHEQFYPEGLPVLALFPLQQFSLALKFKDFSALTAIFNEFQGYE